MWKLGDGYYEIHYTSLSTLMFENFPNKRVLKKSTGGRREWARGEGEGLQDRMGG